MANHSATKKDIRQATKRRDSNRYYGKTTRNAIRELKIVDNQKAYNEKLPNIISQIDKLAKHTAVKAAPAKATATKAKA